MGEVLFVLLGPETARVPEEQPLRHSARIMPAIDGVRAAAAMVVRIPPSPSRYSRAYVVGVVGMQDGSHRWLYGLVIVFSVANGSGYESLGRLVTLLADSDGGAPEARRHRPPA